MRKSRVPSRNAASNMLCVIAQHNGKRFSTRHPDGTTISNPPRHPVLPLHDRDTHTSTPKARAAESDDTHTTYKATKFLVVPPTHQCVTLHKRASGSSTATGRPSFCQSPTTVRETEPAPVTDGAGDRRSFPGRAGETPCRLVLLPVAAAACVRRGARGPAG